MANMEEAKKQTIGVEVEMNNNPCEKQRWVTSESIFSKLL